MEAKSEPYVEKLKKRFNTDVKDGKSLQAKKIKVEGLVDDISKIPGPTRVIGPLSKPSAKPAAPRANDLQPGEAVAMYKG